MAEAGIKVYLNDEDFLFYTAHKAELNRFGREAFKARLEEMKLTPGAHEDH